MAIALEISVILLLIVANGLLSMSEIAVISARQTRLLGHAQDGDARARTALDVAEKPGRFLSTVQIGITLVGILAGALGGATIAEPLAAGLDHVPLIAPYSDALSVGVVVLSITYLTLIFGELVPKRLALNNAEGVAMAVAPPMKTLSRLASPLVRLVSASTNAVLRILGSEPTSEPPVTEEEIKILIEQGTQVGVFEPMEEEMVERVFRLGDRRINAMITPRTEIVWLDLDDPLPETLSKIACSEYSHYPLARGSLDNVLGLVKAADLLCQNIDGRPFDLEAASQPALFVPEGTHALKVLERFKQTRSPIALVIDEFGGIEGLVTVDDFLEAIFGDIPERDEVFEPEIVQRHDGSWLLDGMVPMDEVQEFFHIKELPDAKGYYQTLGGFVMTCLGYIPTSGDHFEWGGLRYEVVDMDGRRVDKVLIAPAAPSEEELG